MFIEIVSKKEKSSVRSDMSSTRAAPTELHFEGVLDAIDGPRLWRSEASKLTHDLVFTVVCQRNFASKTTLRQLPPLISL
jgi:hypothetical protein